MEATSIVVLKAGSSILVQESGELDYTRIANIVSDIAEIRASGLQVVLVTSGAVAAGQFKRKSLRGVPRQQRDQLFAAVGQPKLIQFYSEIFGRHSCSVAQLLLTREAFANRTQYFSVRDTLRSLISNNITPIVNDNDILHQSTEGFSDNDQLAACIAGMLNASMAIFLTTPHGILSDTKKPGSVVELVEDLDGFEKVGTLVRSKQLGRGGMKSKINACRLLFDLGIKSAIASGVPDRAALSVLDGSLKCTRFAPEKPRKLTGVRKWLCTGAVPRGTICVSKQGGEKLIELKQRGSLLATGVVSVKGDFAKGDVVCVCAENNSLLGYGISRCSSEEIAQSRNEERKIVVHADYFYGTAFGFFDA